MVCTNVRVLTLKKKKYFYNGRRVELDEPEEVEIRKIDPKTGENMKILYYFNNDVKKLTDIENCPEYPLLYNYDVKEDVALEGGAKKQKSVKKSGAKKDSTKAKTRGITESTRRVASPTQSKAQSKAQTVVQSAVQIVAKKACC